MNKICSSCYQEKPEEEFPFKGKPKRDSRCKLCKRIELKKHYVKNKALYKDKPRRSVDKARLLIDEMKRKPCADCKGMFPPICMDFDHINNDKNGNVSRMVSSGNITGALDEASKCEIVCSNCHRIRTAERVKKRIEERFSSIKTNAA